MRSLRTRPFFARKEVLTLFINSSSQKISACTRCRYSSSSAPKTISLSGRSYQTDDWYNVPPTIASSIARQLHVQKDHPISITRSIIESCFPASTYKRYNTFFPIVSTHENFDSLGFPADHPGRSKTDTYYVNKDTVLRTHTSAHQADTFALNQSPGFLISADVYRRDAIDRTHYPIFHQMEAARMWDRKKVPGGNIVQAVWDDIAALPTHDMIVEDPNPPMHAERNPLQEGKHTHDEAEAIAAHLKRSLELVVVEIFSRAKKAAIAANPNFVDEPLRVRWVEAYFPFTTPSWELEIFWQGDWLEVLGSGVVKQDIMEKAGVPSQVGWAFGMGLERISMLLFEIPDIRLFWSQDERFLGQFKGVSENMDKLKRFVPFSKFPACYKDVAFWLRSSSSSAGGGIRANAQDFHENDIMEIVRDIGGDAVEDVTQVDEFTHPKTGRKSLCYRINYRSLERTLTNEEANEYHERVRTELVNKLGVELR
ncbi:Phenylalanine--tRNA ligase, mitochondrial [Lachnellula occidentalis]|uniref:Phenylalanine--tRNA ligase, mitochondrial n=1 Tax=Lachnellula occidentalis TaxID=215460 RepID=A0A8H8S7M9_9HELO|nr:Phenylalanine--tRNA ligase, mitochondrial [Lachnellula occidentalis]